MNWATERGLANEATFDEFVRTAGGVRVDSLFRTPQFENADYFFSDDQVVAELKILETEFGSQPEFLTKRDELIRRHVEQNGLRGPFLGQAYPKQFLTEFVELYRAPLARIARKANRQIRETKKQLGINKSHGILICVNDNFREVEPLLVVGLLGRILNGAYSSISGFIYVTNHYVHIPGSEHANLLWVPAYSGSAPESLVSFVDCLGKRWGDFCESRLGLFDSRTETQDRSIVRIARVIK